MPEGLNRVMLLGNLCAEPELRNTKGGQAVLNLRLATNEVYFDKDKNKQERVEYHTITVWGARGEALSRILRKGSQVFIEGSLRTSSYEKDGEKKYKTEINASNVILGSRGGVEGGNRQEGRGDSFVGGGGAPRESSYAPPDDLPFATARESGEGDPWI